MTIFHCLIVESTCPENLAFRLGMQPDSWTAHQFVMNYDIPGYLEEKRNKTSSLLVYQALMEQLQLRGFDNLAE